MGSSGKGSNCIEAAEKQAHAHHNRLRRRRRRRRSSSKQAAAARRCRLHAAPGSSGSSIGEGRIQLRTTIPDTYARREGMGGTEGDKGGGGRNPLHIIHPCCVCACAINQVAPSSSSRQCTAPRRVLELVEDRTHSLDGRVRAPSTPRKSFLCSGGAHDDPALMQAPSGPHRAPGAANGSMEASLRRWGSKYAPR